MLARFTSIEGLSGSALADVLRGDDDDAAAMAPPGRPAACSRNIALITGLQDWSTIAAAGRRPPSPATSSSAAAAATSSKGAAATTSSTATRWLNVRISVRQNADGTGPEIATYDTMTNLELQARVFGGLYNPGQLTIAREILPGSSPDFDTAVFSDVAANYSITTTDEGYLVVAHLAGGAPGGSDGTDVLRNIERVQFSDQAIIFDGSNDPPSGVLTINDPTPSEDQLLTVSAAGVTDADNVSPTNPTGAITGPISYFWQVEVQPGIFEDIVLQNVGGEVGRAVGPTFMPRGFESGFALRVRAVYKDANDVLENVYSDVTAPVEDNNNPPVGTVLISDVTPTETETLQATIAFTDADGLPASPAAFAFQWQQSALGGGGVFTNIGGATLATFTPAQGQVNRQLQVVVSYVDLQGHSERVTSAPTIVTGDFIAANAAAQTLTGNAGQDLIFGGGGNDTINGNAQDDRLDGGDGNDTVNGGDGNDTIAGGAGADVLNGGNDADTITGDSGNDAVNGGAGDDRFIATVGDGNDSYIGGTGIDTYDLSGTTVGATITATTSTSTQTGTDSHTVENIIGSQGNDVITMNGVANVIDGQGGNDNINAGAGADTVRGGDGNDTIAGGTGNDLLFGDAGDDVFNYTIGDGADVIDGGADNDRLNVNGTAAAQTLAVLLSGSAIATIAGSSIVGIEQVAANLLGGVDTLTYGATTTNLTVNLGSGLATGFVSAANIENVTGGSGNDALTGSAAANAIVGGAGNDTITGGAGADSLNGGAGNDTFLATVADGNDAYVGGAGAGDTYDLSGTTAGATVNLLAGTAASAQTGSDTITGIENVTGTNGADTLSGNGFANVFRGLGGNDTISGGSGADVIDGGAGNDTLNGDAGADVITGGTGNDAINGGAGNDRFVATIGDGNDSYIGNTGVDTYDLSGTSAGATVTATTSTSAQTGTDTHTVENIIGSQGNDNINMGAAVVANRVDGQAGNDTINTGGGNDVLIGGQGDDLMNGGTGNDTFIFEPGFGTDVIVGFDANPAGGQDLLNISALGIDAGNFAARVSIVDLGASTMITIDGSDSMLMMGVNGVGTNTIAIGDFILA